MTKSKSPSLASVQGTRPPSGRRLILGFRINETPRKNLISEPAVGFRMETILLAFRFFPSLFFQKSLPSGLSSPEDLLYRKQERLYNLSHLFVNTVSFFFPTFFSSLSGRKLPLRRALLGRNGTQHITLTKICQYAVPLFFSFFSKKIALNEIK